MRDRRVWAIVDFLLFHYTFLLHCTFHNFALYISYFCIVHFVLLCDVHFSLSLSLYLRYISHYISDGAWGGEERNGPPLPLQPDQNFELIILVTDTSYKVKFESMHSSDEQTGIGTHWPQTRSSGSLCQVNLQY